MEKILEVKNLYKSYKHNDVLKNISFDIYRGQNIAILGANGAGKTTLIEIICQTKKATKGQIFYHFKNNKIKDNMGIQFQEGNWPDGLSANDMLIFYKSIYPNINDKNLQDLIAAFDLTEFIKRPLNRLSGGQRQRFNALLAVIHQPELIILDEVSTGLDIQLRHNILRFLKELTKNHEKTIILVSHSPDEVQLLCDRLLILQNGSIFFDIEMKNVIKQYESVAKLMDMFFEGRIKTNAKQEKVS